MQKKKINFINSHDLGRKNYDINNRPFSACHISLVNVQTNYCNNNLLILNVKQLNKIIKLYYFYTLKALCDNHGKIKMYYEMSNFKKQLSGKRSIETHQIHK